MRPLLAITFSLVSTTAFAEPTSPHNYLQAIATAGFEEVDLGDSMFLHALGIEGGHRVIEHLWIHGVVAGGSAASFDRYHGVYATARLGVEGRVCASNEVVCFVGGVDAAVIHLTQVYGAPEDKWNQTSPGGFVRGELDAGGRRLRGVLELDSGRELTHSGLITELSLGVSYRF